MKKRFLFALVLSVSTLFLFAGCVSKPQENDSQRDSINTNQTKSNVEITQSGYFIKNEKYGSSPSLQLTPYCEFKNNGSNPALVKDIKVSVYDNNNVNLATDTMVLAPSYLPAGEIGYASINYVYNLNLSSPEDVARVDFSVEAIPANGAYGGFVCEQPEVVHTEGLGGDANRNILQCIAENKTSVDYTSSNSGFSAVAGLFDENGKLIGCAKTSSGMYEILSGQKSRIQLNDINIESDDLMAVSSISVKAGLPYYDTVELLDTSGPTAQQGDASQANTSAGIIGKWELNSEKADTYNAGYWFKNDGAVVYYTINKDVLTTMDFTFRKSQTGYDIYTADSDTPAVSFYLKDGYLYGEPLGNNGEKMGVVNEYKKVDDFSFKN